MATLGSVMVKFGADVADFQRGFKEVNSGMQDIARKGSELSQSLLGVGAAVTAVGAGIALGFGAAISKAADFEQGLANISAVAPELGAQMSEVKALALQMGAETKYSATEAALGIEELVKAGVSAEAIMSGGLKGALDLATAGGLELADAAEIASTALNAFKADNLTVTQSANILAGAANASATSVGELKYGLSAVSAVASGVGMSFKDTTAALAVFAQNGLKSSDAGTSLKSMLLNLQPSTKAAKSAMKELGIVTAEGKNQFVDANGQFKSLAEISQILQTNMKGLTDAQRLQYMETMFGSDAIRAANILFKEGAKGVNAMKDAMSKTTAEDVAAVKMQTLKGAIEQLKGSFETLMITVGDRFIPIATTLAEKLQGVVGWFQNLSPTMQNVIIFSAAIAGALALIAGPLLLLLGFIPSIVAGFGMVATVFTGIAVGPIIAIIAGIVALGVALRLLWTKSETFRSVVTNAWNAIKTQVMAAVSAVTAFIVEQFEGVREWWYQIWPDLKQAFTNIWNGIWTVLKPIVTLIIELMKWAWPLVKQIIIATWESVKAVISSALEIVMGLVNVFAALFTGNWQMLWNNVKSIFANALTLLWNLFQLWGAGRIIGYLGKLSGWILSLFGKLWSGAKGVFTNGLEAIANAVTTKFNRLVEILTGLRDKFFEIGRNIIDGLKDGIVDAGSRAIQAAVDLASKVKNAVTGLFKIKSPSRVMMEMGGYVSEGFAIGISHEAKSAISAARKMSVDTYQSAGVPVTSANNTASSGNDSAAVEQTVINYNLAPGSVVIPAKDLDEMRSIQDFFKRVPQAARSMGV